MEQAKQQNVCFFFRCEFWFSCLARRETVKQFSVFFLLNFITWHFIAMLCLMRREPKWLSRSLLSLSHTYTQLKVILILSSSHYFVLCFVHRLLPLLSSGWFACCCCSIQLDHCFLILINSFSERLCFASCIWIAFGTHTTCTKLANTHTRDARHQKSPEIGMTSSSSRWPTNNSV